MTDQQKHLDFSGKFPEKIKPAAQFRSLFEKFNKIVFCDLSGCFENVGNPLFSLICANCSSLEILKGKKSIEIESTTNSLIQNKKNPNKSQRMFQNKFHFPSFKTKKASHISRDRLLFDINK